MILIYRKVLAVFAAEMLMVSWIFPENALKKKEHGVCF
jgi:hypothetical protein